MPSSLTHKYIPRIEQNEENLFMEEYFSSTDTKIFMDNEEQTEISYIQYSIQEQLKPIYGYSSRTWDDVAVGNRIVMGTFRVPIKNNERQSTMEEITKKANKSFSIDYSDTINDYNEKENSDLEALMNSPKIATDSVKLQEVAGALASNNDRLSELMELWETLSE